MATYDLDRTELNHLLTPNIDSSARTAVLDYLFNGVTPASHIANEGDHGNGGGNACDDDKHTSHGKTGPVTGKTVEVQVGDAQHLDKDAVVLDLVSPNNIVTTD